MRILQLIDSLNPGGAEKMAMNYFLALEENEKIESYLVATREEGLLVQTIKKKPHYFYLDKSNSIDLRAFLKLKKIVAENKIDLIHAHGSSCYWAVLCKISGSKVKIIWHDHYGNSEFLESRNYGILKFFSFYFDGIIAVNKQLKRWTEEKLNFQKPVAFLPNFIIEKGITVNKKLNGNSKFKLISVANFRPQKDHFNLLNAFDLIAEQYDVSLHLFGKNFEDKYSKSVLDRMSGQKQIYYYGERSDISNYFQDTDVAIIHSISEGLPLVLLEYALSGIPIISTSVGEIPNIVGKYGYTVPPRNPAKLAEEIIKCVRNLNERKLNSTHLQKRIKELYSKNSVMIRYIKFLQVI